MHRLNLGSCGAAWAADYPKNLELACSGCASSFIEKPLCYCPLYLHLNCHLT